MIYSTLSMAERYAGLQSGIDRVLKEATHYTASDPFGRKVILDGENVYINLAEYDTHEKASGFAEAHWQYIDVMCMIEGEETIYVKPARRLQHITKEYDANIDAMLAEIDDDCSAILLRPGDFIILFPEDAHAPACHARQAAHVKKIIGKVRISV